MTQMVDRRPTITLKILREEKGLTQYALARLVGVSQPEISLIERGYYDPVPGGLLQKLAEAVGCEPDALLKSYEDFIRDKIKKEKRRGPRTQSN